MPKVFISHASADREIVTREVIDLLKDHGVEIWMAEDDIASAHQWERSIVEGLKACDWFLVALTPRAAQSEWVKDEVHWAIEERPGRIVPLLIEECDVTQIHIRLARIQYVDFRSANDDARKRLLDCWGVEYRPTARLPLRFKNLADRYSLVARTNGRDLLREYLAKDAVLNRSVLVKCGENADEYELNPFVAMEALATASLAHPAIPRVFDLAHDPQLGTYSVLEHIPGILLRDRMHGSKPSTASDVVELTIPLCEAVHYANERGIIHRNIKPGSIIVAENGRPLLTNFILAKRPGMREPEGQILGTPQYMAPEQCSGKPDDIDCRADVWGLGVMLYELLTGILPFHRKSIEQAPLEIIDDIRHKQPKSPREYNRSIPEALERICLKCIEKDRELRYSTAAELASDLSRSSGCTGGL
jgi:hypothetical protein